MTTSSTRSTSDAIRARAEAFAELLDAEAESTFTEFDAIAKYRSYAISLAALTWRDLTNTALVAGDIYFAAESLQNRINFWLSTVSQTGQEQGFRWVLERIEEDL